MTDLLLAAFPTAHVAAVPSAAPAMTIATNVLGQIFIVDSNLPDADSIETVQGLRAAQPGCDVVVITEHAFEGYREAALLAGAREGISIEQLHIDLVPALRACLVERDEG